MTTSFIHSSNPPRAAGRRTGSTRLRRRVAVSVMAVSMTVTTLVATTARAAASDGRHQAGNSFRQVNLVSDQPGLAKLFDPEVKNPWGIAFGPSTPMWVNNNFSPAAKCPDANQNCIPPAADLLTKVTIYKGANGKDPIKKVPLEVTVSSPFGMVFNPTKSFVIEQAGVRAPATFLFNEEVPDATGTLPVAEITGWTNEATPRQTTTVTTNASKPLAFQLGLALVPGRGKRHGEEHGDRRHKRGPLLLAADGANGVIDIYDGHFNVVHPKANHAFVDPGAVAPDMAPYNVMFLKGRVYVAYTANTPAGTDAVSVFTRTGRFIKRLVTGGPLAGPWGMAVAPEEWGDFGGALLVGNVGDGLINAFDRRSGHFLGAVSDASGNPLANPGLWGLAFGNGMIGTPHTLLFAAGIGSEVSGFTKEGYEHGLVGMIEPVEQENDDD